MEGYIKACHGYKEFIVNITNTYSIWVNMNITSQFSP